jgi:hypothetical protein
VNPRDFGGLGKKNYWPPGRRISLLATKSELLIKRATFVRSVKYKPVEPLILRPSDDLFGEEAGDSVSSPLRFSENVHNFVP